MLKRIFALLLISLAIVFACVYLFIPANLSINNTIIISTTDAHVFQFLTDKKQWAKWWPGTSATNNTEYQYKNNLYTIKNTSNDAVGLIISNPELAINTNLSYNATAGNYVKVNWSGVKANSLNPIVRFNNYMQIKTLKKDIDTVLHRFKQFLEDNKNVYQIDVKITQVKNPIVLTTKVFTPQYPTMVKVYELVGMLRKQIQKEQITEVAPPMLNIHQLDDQKFEVMIGIPINKIIKPGGGTFINNLVIGNILKTRVKGGLNTVNNAFNQLENYRKDHHLVSPAIPFESLITDRSAETDTAKWITEIYYPIF